MMASLLTRFVKKLVIYTSGSEEVETKWKAMIAQRDDMTTENRKIKQLVNNPSGGISVELDDGTIDSHAFLYHNPTTAPNIDMAKDLGPELSEAGTEVKSVQPFYETNVKGCFAIGDVGSQSLESWPSS
jgi:thioredoxin reductase